MKVQELLKKIDLKEFKQRLIELYPDDKEIADGYIYALDRCKNLVPDKTKEDFTITLRQEDDGWIEVLGKKLDDPQTYALTLTPEEEMVWMEVDPDLKYPELDIAVHIMYEICFHGFQGTEKAGALADVTKALEAMQNMDDDQFVTLGNVKMHRDVIDVLDIEEDELREFAEEFEKKVKENPDDPPGNQILG